MIPTRFYTFQCPVCKKEYTYDEPGEPLCDGPGAVSSHEPAVMWRIRVKDRNHIKEVDAVEGEARAKGTLLTPEALVNLGARVYGRLWIPKDKVNPWTGEEMDERIDPEPKSVEIHDGN